MSLPRAWRSVSLSAGGDFGRLSGEIDLCHQAGVGLYEGDVRLKQLDAGKAILTSLRLIWTADAAAARTRPSPSACMALELKDIKHASLQVHVCTALPLPS